MFNAKDYTLAWQSASFTFNKMYNQNFRNFYYAANSYYNYFNSQANANSTFATTTIDPANWTAIWSDPTYGMNSTKAMTWWVGASVKGENSVYYETLIDHFAERGIDLTSAMPALVGSTAKVTT